MTLLKELGGDGVELSGGEPENDKGALAIELNELKRHAGLRMNFRCDST